MKGLLYKDNMTIFSAYKKNALLVLIIYSAMAVAMDMDYMFFAMVFLVGLYTAGTLNFDESSHWDSYVRTLPVSSAAIVGEKYLLSALWSFGGAGIALLLCVLCSYFKHRPTDSYAESLCGIAVVLAMTLFYSAVSLPLSYKFGASKARVNVMLSLVLLFVGVPFLLHYAIGKGVPMPAFLTGLDALTAWQAAALLGLLVLAVLALCGISCVISIRIYDKKEC